MQDSFCKGGGDPSDDIVSNKKWWGRVFQAVLAVNSHYAETGIYTPVLILLV